MVYNGILLPFVELMHAMYLKYMNFRKHWRTSGLIVKYYYDYYAREVINEHNFAFKVEGELSLNCKVLL
jgi:hypothetical protein